jgi:hypothetical protein
VLSFNYESKSTENTGTPNSVVITGKYKPQPVATHSRLIEADQTPQCKKDGKIQIPDLVGLSIKNSDLEQLWVDVGAFQFKMLGQYKTTDSTITAFTHTIGDQPPTRFENMTCVGLFTDATGQAWLGRNVKTIGEYVGTEDAPKGKLYLYLIQDSELKDRSSLKAYIEK